MAEQLEQTEQHGIPPATGHSFLVAYTMVPR